MIETETDARTVLEFADKSAEKGDDQAARAGYRRLVELEAFTDWALFSLGRLATRAGEPAEALDLFVKAIGAEPNFFWAHYERLAVLLSLDLKPAARCDQLAEAAQHVAGEVPPSLGGVHTKHIEQASELLWTAEYFQPAVRLLEWISGSAECSELSLLRVVERSGRPDILAQARDRLMSRGLTSLGNHALRVLSNHFRAIGDAASELDVLRQYWRVAPKEFAAFLGLGRRLAEDKLLGELEELRAAETVFPPAQRSFAELVFLVEQGAFREAAYRITEHARLYDEVPIHLAIRIAYKLIEAQEDQLCEQIVALLSAWHETQDSVAVLRINLCIRRQDWDTAWTLFANSFKGRKELSTNVRLIEIDLLAYTGDLEAAIEKLKAERVEGVYPQRFVEPAVRLLGEAGVWNEVVDVGLDALPDDPSFNNVLAPALRAARKCGRVLDLYKALVALPEPLNTTQRLAFEAVLEDLILYYGGDPKALLGEKALSKQRQKRLRLLQEPAGVRKRPWAVFFCVDRGYLSPGFTSLTSAILSNFDLVNDIDFYVLADHEIFDDASVLGDIVSDALKQSIQVVSSNDVIPDTSRLKETYGIFTGGQSLSLAAYYRIFCAQYLLETQEYERLLYIDSDTLIRGGLTHLFNIEMNAPVLARHEVPRPEVDFAKKQNSILGPYFNSGVLLFDGQHPDLAAALEKAASAAVNPEIELVFQDQCALNIAFDQKAGAMPKRFNAFLSPYESPEAIEDAVIIHYLDRPKPWDSLYLRDADEWLDAFAFLRQLCGDALLLPGVRPS